MRRQLTPWNLAVQEAHRRGYPGGLKNPVFVLQAKKILNEMQNGAIRKGGRGMTKNKSMPRKQKSGNKKRE